MNDHRKPNLTINMHADDHYRSSNRNNNIIRIQTNSLQMLYPQSSMDYSSPSVPVCHQQAIANENLDRKIEANFE